MIQRNVKVFVEVTLKKQNWKGPVTCVREVLTGSAVTTEVSALSGGVGLFRS
jgi:hypothetical protein